MRRNELPGGKTRSTLPISQSRVKTGCPPGWSRISPRSVTVREDDPKDHERVDDGHGAPSRIVARHPDRTARTMKTRQAAPGSAPDGTRYVGDLSFRV